MTTQEEILLQNQVREAIERYLISVRSADLGTLAQSSASELRRPVSRHLVNRAVWRLMADGRATFTPEYNVRLKPEP